MSKAALKSNIARESWAGGEVDAEKFACTGLRTNCWGWGQRSHPLEVDSKHCRSEDRTARNSICLMMVFEIVAGQTVENAGGSRAIEDRRRHTRATSASLGWLITRSIGGYKWRSSSNALIFKTTRTTWPPGPRDHNFCLHNDACIISAMKHELMIGSGQSGVCLEWICFQHFSNIYPRIAYKTRGSTSFHPIVKHINPKKNFKIISKIRSRHDTNICPRHGTIIRPRHDTNIRPRHTK